MKTAAIIPAAGQGSRMGRAKQLILLGGKSVIDRTVEMFDSHAEIDEIIIAASENIHIGDFAKIKRIVPGGGTRQESVRMCLEAVSGDVTHVLIHDGARPLVSSRVISGIIEAISTGGCAVSGVISKDTIKVTGEDNIIESTPPRGKTWLVQTPQGFPLDIIKKAHEAAEADGFTGTDDAVLAERSGIPVRMVEGDYGNIKLTTPEDILLAEALLHKRTL